MEVRGKGPVEVVVDTVFFLWPVDTGGGRALEEAEVPRMAEEGFELLKVSETGALEVMAAIFAEPWSTWDGKQ